MKPVERSNEMPAPETGADGGNYVEVMREIPLDQIERNPYQPRRYTAPETMEELVASIQEHGVLQPVLVRPIGPDRYQLIAGERRCCAARRAGLTSVPALVREFTDQEQAEIALIENLQRQDLKPVETALAYRALMNDFGLKLQQIGVRVGKSFSAISNTVRLLKLSEEILDSLNRGEIQEGHAQALLHIEDEALRADLWRQVVTDRLSRCAKPENLSVASLLRRKRQSKSRLCRR